MKILIIILLLTIASTNAQRGQNGRGQGGRGQGGRGQGNQESPGQEDQRVNKFL